MRVLLSSIPRLLPLWLLLACGVARAETLTLADCLREAAEHNPAIATQRRVAEQAFGARLTLRARALPRLSIGLVGGQQGSQGETVLRSYTVRDSLGNKVVIPQQTVERSSNFYALGSGSLTQPLFDAAIPASWRRGSAEVAIARQNFAVVVSAQLHAVRLQYYQALFQRDTAAVLQSIADRLDANAKTAGDLAKAGLATQQALLQAQVQRANFGPPILAAEGGYRTALTALLGLMGRDLGPGADDASDPIKRVSLGGSLDDEKLLSFDAPQSAALALERRPDLLAMRETLRANVEDARIIRAGYYPRILLYVNDDVVPENFVTGSRPSNSVRPGDDVRTSEVRYGGRYDWVVIDTGGVRGAARRTDRLREVVAASLQRAEQNVPRGLALLRAQNIANESQLDSLRSNVSTAEETLNIVSGAVAQGTSSQLDFLDAQTSLLNTRVTLIQTQLQVAQTRAEFDRLTGGYLRFVSQESPGGNGKQPDKKP
jgi:outer membrane protein TolC